MFTADLRYVSATTVTVTVPFTGDNIIGSPSGLNLPFVLNVNPLTLNTNCPPVTFVPNSSVTVARNVMLSPSTPFTSSTFTYVMILLALYVLFALAEL